MIEEINNYDGNVRWLDGLRRNKTNWSMDFIWTRP
jgi:hypothetical protein